MTGAIPLGLALAMLAAVCVALRAMVGAYLRFRGTRVVTCPETQATVAVELDAVPAALTTGLPTPELRVTSCSHWPERHDCGQRCLREIRSAPDGCLALTMVTGWYQGKACVICGKAFGEIAWTDRKPALMSPERRTVEWHDVPAESLPAVLSTHLPVCWDCHIARRFRREHPELVVDRPRRSQAAQRHVA
jgi:hypothetical protein